MAKVLRIGVVGCGAIGSSLAQAVRKDFRGKAVLAGLYDIDRAKTVALERRLGVRGRAAKDLAGLIGRCDLVVESSSAAVSGKIAREVLTRGKSVVVMSVGGILNRVKALAAICASTGGKLYIPSGAIAGIDAVKAAAVGGIRRVTLVTTKHPRSFKGVEYVRRKGIDLDGIRAPVLLFSGSARAAVNAFPQNINVAAVLSLAGVGASRTTVKIIASPLATKNIHEIIIESASGKVVTRTENLVHPDNPKTSYLAVLSAVALLKEIVEPVRIGT